MNVRDFDGNHDVRTIEQLDAILPGRHYIDHRQVNSFWLSFGNGFPSLCIMVVDELATAWYAPREADAGFVSAGTVHTLENGGITMFYVDKQQQEVGNHLIIRWVEAVEAARQFLESSGPPQSLRWIEL